MFLTIVFDFPCPADLRNDFRKTLWNENFTGGFGADAEAFRFWISDKCRCMFSFCGPSAFVMLLMLYWSKDITFFTLHWVTNTYYNHSIMFLKCAL